MRHVGRYIPLALLVLLLALILLTGCAGNRPARTEIRPGESEMSAERDERRPTESRMTIKVTNPPPTPIRIRITVPDDQCER